MGIQYRHILARFERGRSLLTCAESSADPADGERAKQGRRLSARAHLGDIDDHVARVAPTLERAGDFKAFLGEPFDQAVSYVALRKAKALTARLAPPNG